MKKVVIMRGWPGTLKSTRVKELVKDLDSHEYAVCSADDYFCLKTGEYIFNHEELGSAHGYSHRIFRQAIAAGVPVVVVDATNTTYKECKYYIQYGALEDYQIHLLEGDAPWKNDLKACASKNVHKVPIESIRKMADRYQPNEVIAQFALENLGVNIYYES
jgi:tRNA uridine 5-carbamoylmethylation protein Kti12